MTGIVVIAWNSGEVIGRCLDACLKLPDTEVAVVDNASSDNTVEEVEKRLRVRLIRNRENRGFAGGANQGIEALPHPTVLLLNPDAEPLAGVDELARKAGQPGVGAAGGQLLGPDGLSQTGFNVRAFPTPASLSLEVLGMNRVAPGNRWNRQYRHATNESTDSEVDQPAGAFLMVNRAAWAAVGGFDEKFHPVWFEDVDFCLRLKGEGFRILYVPSATARHLGGHSASRLEWGKRQLFWYGSLLRYASKHFQAGGRRLVSAAVMLACFPRALFGLFSGRSLTAVSVYSRVFRAAWDVMRNPNPCINVARSSSREENRARQLPG